MNFWVNLFVSALVIATAVELGKRSSWLAAILISLPLSSIVALSLTYFDSHDSTKVLALSQNICLLILPSLIFFIFLSLFIRHGLRVPLAIPAACIVMISAYALYSFILKSWGLQL